MKKKNQIINKQKLQALAEKNIEVEKLVRELTLNGRRNVEKDKINLAKLQKLYTDEYGNS